MARFNPLPLVFTPGVALVGYFAGRWNGLLIAVAAWVGLLAVGTAIVVGRQIVARLQNDVRDVKRPTAIAKTPPPH